MRDVNLLLTNDEKRTRFQWLIAFLVMMAFGFIGQIVDLFNPQAELKTQYPNSYLYSYLCMLIFTLIYGVIQYYCIYLKQGTRWLTFNIILFPIGFLKTIYMMAYPNPVIPVSNWRMTASLLLIAVSWVLSIKLRKVNKRIQSVRKNPPA